MHPDFADCFLNTTPPKNHVFSHQAMPCRFEPPLPKWDEGKLVCPFKKNGYCERIDGESVLERSLTRAYTNAIKNVLSEPSTSLVIRSEQQFHGRDRLRFSQRRHFFEVLRSPKSKALKHLGTRCTPLDAGDRLGEYIGFVDLRQFYDVSPLALGLLAVPRSMREDPAITVITGDYGPLFGAHSFQSTVYSMQDPDTTGAMCAQICAIMVLGMLADRGAEIKGSFTLTYLAALQRQQRQQSLSGGLPAMLKRVDEEAGTDALFSFPVGGMSPRELRDVLQACGASADLICLDASDVRRGSRLIEAYIYAKFPVILAVDAWTWKPKHLRPSEPETSPHAVTVVGLRRDACGGDLPSLIVHDPASQPFWERKVSECFEAAYAMDKLNKLIIVGTADSGITRHANDCIEGLLDDPLEDEVRLALEGRDGWDLQIRLLRRGSLFPVLLPEMQHDDTVMMALDRIPD
jgi:hypothetical protein